MKSVTIITVNYHSHLEIKNNWMLFHALNSNACDVNWIIADNSYETEPFVSKKIKQQIKVVEGFEKREIQQASYQHGSALNALLPHIQSNFLIVMDPDFFVIENDWLNKSLDYMLQKNLTMFGSTWHDKWQKTAKPSFGRKWNDFPNCHFLIINLDRIDRHRLDFRPDNMPRTLPVKDDFSRDTGYRIRYDFLEKKDYLFEIIPGTDTPKSIENIMAHHKVPQTIINLNFLEYYKKSPIINAVHFRRSVTYGSIKNQYQFILNSIFDIAENHNNSSNPL